MLTEKTMERLRILAESAKYDVSCSSSGIRERINPRKQLNDMPHRYWRYMTEKN